MSDNNATVPLAFQSPTLEDAAGITTLIRRCPPLDANSHYAYLLLCHHFAETCVVAKKGDEVVAFLSGYRPPTQDDVVFVWQVAVGEKARGQGVASKLVKELLARPACEGVRFIETTISPSNAASQKLFKRTAEKLDAPLESGDLFGVELFEGVDDQHEAEQLYRIGPIDPKHIGRKD